MILKEVRHNLFYVVRYVIKMGNGTMYELLSSSSKDQWYKNIVFFFLMMSQIKYLST